MEEKRKHKRLDLDVEIQLERLDEEGVTTLKYVHVDVTDIYEAVLVLPARRNLRPALIMTQRSRSGQRKL